MAPETRDVRQLGRSQPDLASPVPAARHRPRQATVATSHGWFSAARHTRAPTHSRAHPGALHRRPAGVGRGNPHTAALGGWTARYANEPCSPRPGRAAALHRTPGRSAARDSVRTPGAPPPPRRSADQVRRHAPVARASRVGATIGHPCHAAPRQAGGSDACASEPNGVPPPRAPIAARRQRGPMPSRTAQPTLWFTTDRPKRGPRRRGGLPECTATRPQRVPLQRIQP